MEGRHSPFCLSPRISQEPAKDRRLDNMSVKRRKSLNKTYLSVWPAWYTEEIELYPEPGSSTTDKDRINNWINISVAGAIESGNKLRRNKPAPYLRKDGLPKLAKSRNPQKRYTRKSIKNVTSSCGCSYWSTPPLSNTVVTTGNSAHNRIKIRIKADKQPKCTVRTAQLAAPTKRHCLDTWRNNSKILPSIMIERLKEHIMDQRPIVQISEAIDGFQLRKSRRRKNKTCTKTNIRQLPTRMPQRLVDTIKMCLIFSQIIALKLARPLNIKLDPKLENLARVVSNEIAKVTYPKKGTTEEYIQQYKSIHTDVTYKITIWIADVLDELYYKLIEEDLKDLEEEEGPVLDFLDIVVEQVLDICLPKPNTVHVEQESNNVDSSIVDPNQDEIWQAAINNNVTDAEYFRNEIYNLISNIYKDTDDMKDGDYFRKQIFNLTENIDMGSDNLELTDKEYFAHEILNTIEYLFKDSDVKLESGESYSHNDDQLTDKEYFENLIHRIISIIIGDESRDKIDEWVDDVIGDEERSKFEVSELSEDTNEDSKNVMFSNSDMVSGHENTTTIKGKIAKHPRDSGHKKRSIIFAEPNQHVLSDADELWPEDHVTPHMLRPSASVTKSILSLGNLWETDEKHVTTSQANGNAPALGNLTRNSQDKEAVKSIMSLVRILQSDQKNLPLESVDTTIDDVNLLNSKSQMEITMTVASLINILHNDEHLTPEDINAIVTEKLTLLNVKLPNEEATTSLVTLLNILRDDEKLLSATDTNAYIAVKIASLNLHGDKLTKTTPSEKVQKDEKLLLGQGKILKATTSLVNILQNYENQKPEEYKAVITENLKLLDATLTDGKVTEHIEQLLNKLQITENQLTPAEANVFIAEILALINSDLHDEKLSKSIEMLVENTIKDENNLTINPATTKTMSSLLNILQDDENYLKLTDVANLGGLASQDMEESHKLQTLIATYLNDKCNTQSQTDQVALQNEVTLKATDVMITSFDPKQEDVVSKANFKHANTRYKVKNKNKAIATDPTGDITHLYNDWKVRLESAPSWIAQVNAHGEPSEDSVTAQAKSTKLAKCDVNKWSKNLSKGFRNLEIWSDWLQNTCKQTASLLRKRKACVYFMDTREKHWLKLRHNVTKDAILWRNMNKRTQEMFKTFQQYYGNTQVSSSKHQSKCACNNNVK